MIRLDHIHRDFPVGEQKVHALHDVRLHITAGEYISIMGPSGSGKSTLLNIIGLLDRPSTGVYRLEGEDVTALSDQRQSQMRRQKIGFVFQFFHLVPRLSAAENVELPLVLAGVSPAERLPSVKRLLDEFGLSHRASIVPSNFPAVSASAWPSRAPW